MWHRIWSCHGSTKPNKVQKLFFYQPGARPAGPKITLLFPRLYVYMCICTYHVRNNYVTYIVAMRPYYTSPLRQFRRLLFVATMSSLPQL